MTALTGKKPKDTYKDLLQVSNANAGLDGTLRPVSDGEGNDSALHLSGGAARLAGPLDFAGADHAGIRLNNLTTAERDAVAAAAGNMIHNSSLGRAQWYDGTRWGDVLSASSLASYTLVPSYSDRFTQVGVTPEGAVARMRPDADAVLTSSFLRPGGTAAQWQEDFQAALDAAVGTDTEPGLRKLCFNRPGVYYLTSTLANKFYAQVPYLVSANPASGNLTFNMSLGLADGSPVELQGNTPAGIAERTRYFARNIGYGVYALYGTAAQARAGGSTGLVMPAADVVTTATTDQTVTTTAIGSGTNAVDVADARHIAQGSIVQLRSGSSTAPFTVQSVTPTTGDAATITFVNNAPAAYPSGSVVVINSAVLADMLNAVVGSTIAVAGSTNSAAGLVITAIDAPSKRVTYSQVAGPAVVAAAATLGCVADLRFLNLHLEITAVPGVILKKATNFSGNAMIEVGFCGSASVHHMKLEGLSTSYVANVVAAGDDGVRISSSHNVEFMHNELRHFGDSALRARTSTYDRLSGTASQPDQGVNTAIVKDMHNVYVSCAQTSTTANDFFHGGVHEYWQMCNTYIRMRTSVKLANRVQGARNIFAMFNTILGSGRHGYEIDSDANITVASNNIFDCLDTGIAILSNNNAGQPGQAGRVVGFPWHNVRVHQNNIHRCKNGVTFAVDSYPDGYHFDQCGVAINDNNIYDVTNPAGYGINYASGSPKGLEINRNRFFNFAGACLVQVLARGDGVAGFRNNIQVCGNEAVGAARLSAGGNGIRIEQSGGPARLQGAFVKDNQIDFANPAQLFYFDGVDDLVFEGNRGDCGAGSMGYFGTQGCSRLAYRNNRLTNAGTGGVIFDHVNGARVEGNDISVGSGTAITFNNSCAGTIHYLNNRPAGPTPLNARQVPIVTRPAPHPGREEYGTALPAAGTFVQGSEFVFANAAAGGVPRSRCVQGGTAGTLAGVTGNSASGSPTITGVAGGTAGIAVGSYITHPGWSGAQEVTGFVANTSITVAANATADSTGGAVAYSAPAWKGYANLAA